MGNANDLVAKLKTATGQSTELNLLVFNTLFPNASPLAVDTLYADFTGSVSATLRLLKRCAPEASVSLSIRLNVTTAIVTINQRPASTVHPNPEIALLIATIIALSTRV